MKSAIIISLLSCLLSCRKFVEISPAPNLVVSDKVFESEETAISAVYGLYINMRVLNLNIINGGATVYGSLSAGDIYNTSSTSSANPFFTNQLLSNNSIVSFNFWNKAYTNIYHANLIIEKLENSPLKPESVRNQLVGEAKLVRALYYFYMVNFFGDVPLVTGTDYNVNGRLPRASSQQIYEVIIDDLESAKSLMPEKYPLANRTRPNSYAAAALLAKVFLFVNQWEKAEAEATYVLSNTNYSLLGTLNEVFLINSKEIIWQLGSESSNTAEGGAFIPSSATARPAYALTNQLLRAFDPDDKRLNAWVRKNTVSTIDYFYPYKCKARQTATPVAEYQVLLRLSDILLVRSEARIKQGKLTGTSGADEDINKIRERAGLTKTTFFSEVQALDSLYVERQRELFCESGNRWFDLKRWGIANHVLHGQKPFWKPEAALYPIPDGEINRNNALVQNAGY